MCAQHIEATILFFLGADGCPCGPPSPSLPPSAVTASPTVSPSAGPVPLSPSLLSSPSLHRSASLRLAHSGRTMHPLHGLPGPSTEFLHLVFALNDLGLVRFGQQPRALDQLIAGPSAAASSATSPQAAASPVVVVSNSPVSASPGGLLHPPFLPDSPEPPLVTAVGVQTLSVGMCLLSRKGTSVASQMTRR